MFVRSFRDLKIWQEAFALSLEIYRASARFPSTEKFGLTSQIRRSSVSVAANIAEGRGRNSTKELIHFLYVARGSLYETQCHCLMGKELGYFDKQFAEKIVGRYQGLDAGINACINALKAKSG